MKARYQEQAKLDDAMLAYAMMENYIDVAKQGNREVKGFRSGIGGIVSKRDAALLTVTPPIHVNPPTEDPKDIAFASEILEPWLAGMWRFSQQEGPVWDRLPRSLNALGRAWSRVDHYDSIWSDDNSEYKSLKEALEKTKDEDELKDAQKAMEEFKRDELPIRWKFVDARGTWFDPDNPRRLAEVVEIRNMSIASMKEQGWDLPSDIEDASDDAEQEVVFWSNWHFSAVMVQDKIVHDFHHNMGKSPYSLMEAELMLPNNKGLRWAGSLFYAQGMIDTFDELLSDLRENHRDNTRANPFVKHDKDAEDAENAGGRPAKLPYGPNYSGIVDLWSTEEVGLMPVPVINEQSITLLQFTFNLIQMTQIRPVEQGESKSGDSQNKYVTQLQVAERGFDPHMRAINECAWDVCRSFLRCVRALGETVYVVPGFKGKGVIGLDPKKTRGWEYCIQPRARRAIPIDENIEAALAQKKLQIGLPPETVLEEMGYENAQKEIRKARKARLAEAVDLRIVVPMVLARLQQLANTATPQQLTEISEMAAGAPDALLSAAQNAGANVMTGGERTGMANELRTGVPQLPQQPQEQVAV